MEFLGGKVTMAVFDYCTIKHQLNPFLLFCVFYHLLVFQYTKSLKSLDCKIYVFYADRKVKHLYSLSLNI